MISSDVNVVITKSSGLRSLHASTKSAVYTFPEYGMTVLSKTADICVPLNVTVIFLFSPKLRSGNLRLSPINHQGIRNVNVTVISLRTSGADASSARSAALSIADVVLIHQDV